MKRNIAEEITNRILEDLEKGVTPWEKPWKQKESEGPGLKITR
jgi:antirestriction protein ArdC